MVASVSLGNLANFAQVVSVFVFPALFLGGRIIWKRLKAEMSPNHGSSMRDAIDRIEQTLEDLVSEQKKNRKAIKKVTRDFEAHLAELEE